MRKYKDEGKSSAMKEILNLTEYYCFRETDYNKSNQEAKDKVIIKRNGMLKTR